MADFVAEEYKQRLAASQSCETCEKVPTPKLAENTRYIFISYSHKDYKKVYCDLADLYESDIPFWYDEGLPAGKNWDDVVREKMTDSRCVGIIFFMSENLFLSRSIQTEIKIAIGEDGDSNLPQIRRDYFCVNLTDLSPSKILRRVYPIKEFPDTEDEMVAQSLWQATLTKAFPDKATFLPFDNDAHKDKLIEQIDVNFGIKPNYNPYAFGDALFRSGKGEIVFPNGAIYEGAFVDNLFEGQGKLTYSSGAVYDGEWVKGKQCGQGVFTRPDGIAYDGEWLDGMWHGYGVLTFSDGASYDGEWLDGMWHGHGIFTHSDGSVYDGEWSKDQKHGHGVFTFSAGAVYDGEWSKDQMHGHGIFTHSDGSVYDGEWSKDQRHGHGVLTFSDGSVYDGEWVAGEMCGQCTFIRGSDGHKYVGGWREDGSAGFGTHIYPDGASRSGTWNGDVLVEGEGVIRYEDGSEYNGQIRNNLRHGTGTLTLPDGTKQTGRFENDVFLQES